MYLDSHSIGCFQICYLAKHPLELVLLTPVLLCARWIVGTNHYTMLSLPKVCIAVMAPTEASIKPFLLPLPEKRNPCPLKALPPSDTTNPHPCC